MLLLQAFLLGIAVAGLAFLGLLGFVAVTVTMNSIRAAIHSRRDEVTIMQLVGAPRWMVRGPFVIEGAITGALSGALAGIADPEDTEVTATHRNFRGPHVREPRIGEVHGGEGRCQRDNHTQLPYREFHSLLLYQKPRGYGVPRRTNMLNDTSPNPARWVLG